MKRKLFFLLSIVLSTNAHLLKAQSVVIDPNSSNSAIIEGTSTTKGFVPPRMTEAQRNNMLNLVIGTIVYCTDCTTGAGVYSYNGSAWTPMFVAPPPPTPSYTIGQSIFGGKIFFIDESGQHGLVAATADVGGFVQWFNGNYTNTKAVRFGVYGGEFNTNSINLNQGTGNYAAIIAAKHNGSGYGDWYLPSRDELQLMYNQKAVIGGFANAQYWSSTEITVNAGQVNTVVNDINFATGTITNASKNLTAKVRPIRRF